VLAAAILGTLLVFQQRSLRDLLAEREDAWKNGVQNTLGLVQHDHARFAQILAQMPAIAQAIRTRAYLKPDPQLDEMLNAYFIHRLWIYSVDGKLLFEWAKTDLDRHQEPPIDPLHLPGLLRSGLTRTFSGEVGRELVLVTMAPVPSEPAQKEGARVEGFVIAGRLWRDPPLARILPTGMANVSIREFAEPPPQLTLSEKTRGALLYTEAMLSWDRRPVGRLIVSEPSPVIRRLVQSIHRALTYITFLAFFIIIGVVFAVTRSVSAPLARISVSLRQETAEPLDPIRDDPTEIGQIARMIDESFAQREALKRARERFAELVNSIEGIVWEADPESFEFTFVSDRAEAILGYPPQVWYEPGFWVSRIHPDDREWAPAFCRRMTRLLKPHVLEYRMMAADGRVVWLRDIVSVRADPGRAVLLRGIMVDITKVTEAQEQARLEHQRLKVTLESLGEGVIATDRSGLITLMNRTAEKLTGWNSGAAEGQLVSDVLRIRIQQTGEEGEVLFRKVLEEAVVAEPVGDTTVTSRDGSGILISVAAAPIRDNTHISGMVVVFRDETERWRIHQEMERLERLEALGLLAGGIAHDFNNMLTAVLANVHIALVESEKNPDLRELLSGAEKATLKAAALAQQLLTFAKGGAPARESTDLATLVRETVEFCLRGSLVRARFTMPADLWKARVDPAQISQVIQNLVLNAVEAMPTGGTVSLSLENTDIPDKGRGFPQMTLSPGPYVKVTVADEGTGIAPEYLPRIFDPYFSTKRRGSGLGLAIVHSIVRRHGGHITVSSRRDSGATFAFYLPAEPSCVPPEEGPRDPRFALPDWGKKRILVMDDEEVVRLSLRQSLERVGMDPEFARDGDEACLIYESARDSGSPFDVVILDLTIPGGMGGIATLSRLKERDPAVRAIVTTGYSEEPVLADFRKFGFHGALAKPFTLNDIIRVLAGVFQEPGDSSPSGPA
jgi:PAS domain S-box-containing protein